MTKKTQKDWLNDVIALATENGREDLVEWANGRIKILDNKTANKKPTATQEANAAYKAQIAEVLASAGKPVRISEIIEALPELKNTQKVTALLRQMPEVERVMDKKTALFGLKSE